MLWNIVGIELLISNVLFIYLKYHFHLCRPSSTLLLAFFNMCCPREKWHLLITMSQLSCWQLFSLEWFSKKSAFKFQYISEVHPSYLWWEGTHHNSLENCPAFSVKEVKTLQPVYFQRNEERPQYLKSLWYIEWRHILLIKIPACPKTLVVGTKQCQSSHLRGTSVPMNSSRLN